MNARIRTANTIIVMLLFPFTTHFVFAIDAGQTTPGSNNYPNDLPRRVSGVRFSQGRRGSYTCMAGDFARGYGYIGQAPYLDRFGAVVYPGGIIKCKLGFGAAAPTFVNSIDLGNTDSPKLALLDANNGYAYFSEDSGNTSTIFKVALGAGDAPPQVVSQLTLNANEQIISGVIDTQNGYAYYGTNNTPGTVVKVALGAGNAAPVRLGATPLNMGEDMPRCAAVDTTAGYAYFGTFTDPAIVVQVALGLGNNLPTRISAAPLNASVMGVNNVGEVEAVVAAIDTLNGYLYVGTRGNGNLAGFTASARIVKLALSPNAPPQRLNSTDLIYPDECGSYALIDVADGYLYTIDYETGPRVSKIGLGVGPNPPIYAGTYSLECDTGGLGVSLGAIDTSDGYVYALNGVDGNGDAISTIAKIPFNGNGPPGGDLGGDRNIYGSFYDNTDILVSTAIDPVHQKGYLLDSGIQQTNCEIVQVDLGVSNAPPAMSGAIGLSTPLNPPNFLGIDVTNGYLYSARFYEAFDKSNLSSLKQITQTVDDLDFYNSPVIAIDSANQYGYLANSKLEKFALSTSPTDPTPMLVNAGNPLDLLVGLTSKGFPNTATCCVLDIGNHMGYLGTNSGVIVQVDLGVGGAAPLYVASFSPGAGPIGCAVIDTVNHFAYFGTTTAPGQIVQVALGAGPASLVSTISMLPGEDGLQCAVSDLTNGCAFFGTQGTPGQVIKVALTSGANPLARIGSITFQAGENNLMSAGIDPTTGYAYFTPYNPGDGGRLVKVATTVNGRMKASRISIPENATMTDMHFYSNYAQGNLRLALYDNSSPKNLIWQSGVIPNNAANSEIVVPFTSGTPGIVTLTPGTYWVAWQSDAVVNVPSFTPGSSGDGFYLDASFGPYPAVLGGETTTDERWTQYVAYVQERHLQISGMNMQTAGTTQMVTLTAVNGSNNVETDYTGLKTLVFSGANPTTNPAMAPTINGQPFNQPISVLFAGGSATVPLTLFKAETAAISYTDPSIAETTATPLAVAVSPAAEGLGIVGSSVVGAGSPNLLTVTAQDIYGNVYTNYAGVQMLTFSGPGISPSPPTPPIVAAGSYGMQVAVPFTNGVATVSTTLFKAENAAISVTDGMLVQIAPLSVTVNPIAAAKFTITGNATQVAGTAQVLTVTALDQYGNTATGQTGTLNLTFSGAGNSPNSSQPTANGVNFLSNVPLVFVSGLVSVPVVLVKTGPAAIAATSGALNTPAPLSIAVAPSSAVSFQLSGLATQTQNTSQPLTLTATDAFGNFANTYTGTVTFASSDSLASVPANYTFKPNDAGNGVPVPVTLRTAGPQTVSATDVANSTLTEAFNIFVAAATPASIAVVQGNGQSATVATAFGTTLQAIVKDGANNPIAGVSVTFTAPASGATGSFAGSASTLTNNAGVATAPVFTANTQPGAYSVTAAVNALHTTFNLTNTVDVPISLSVLQGSNQSATVGRAFATPLEAVLLDRFNNPVPNTTVVFTVPPSGASATFGGSNSVQTDVNGIATAPTVTANTTPGAFNVTASAGALFTTFNLTDLNDAPVAANQNLSVVTLNPLSVTLTATDLTNPNLAYTVVTTPQHGALTGAPPQLTYTPTAGFTGPDTFTFKANDGQLDSNIATIFITVQPNPSVPTVSALSQVNGTLNQTPFTLVVTGTDFVNGSVVNWNGQALATTFNSATQLSASVTATQLANAGSIPVTVQNPVPLFALSNALPFLLYSGPVGTWIVTNTNDAGQGSLRLAMASAQANDQIIFDPVVFDLTSSNAATLINVLSALPPLDKGSVTINAQDRRVTVNGSGAGSSCGLTISSSNNVVTGLTIVGFQRSGILIMGGATNNQIGGNRNTGAGPNGQGLRISSNGTYGIDITDPGTTGNVVTGCWVGLDASGLSASPNLAGIIIEAGAPGNVIGGTTAGQENIISGNSLEGLTITGAGTDNNVLISNVVGESALPPVATRDASLGGRSALGNGSSGVFLSKGTKSSKVGGGSTDSDDTAALKSNTIGSNGGNGIEVHASTSIGNSSRHNHILNNAMGGIALFDGSNGGVNPPSFTTVVSHQASTANSAATRATTTVVLSGTASNHDGSPGSGTVEVFQDAGSQGAAFGGRSAVSGGAWTTTLTLTDLTSNLTATFTDNNGNTSQFAVFGPPPATMPASNVPTWLELLAGSDPNNSADTPILEGTVTSSKLVASLNFVKPTADALQGSLTLTLPSGFSFNGATVAFQIDSVIERVTLNSKAKPTGAPSGLAFRVTVPKNSKTAVLQYAIRKQDLTAGLAPSGLTNKTVTAETDTLPIGVALIAPANKYVYSGTATVHYTAKMGKSGQAKQ